MTLGRRKEEEEEEETEEEAVQEEPQIVKCLLYLLLLPCSTTLGKERTLLDPFKHKASSKHYPSSFSAFSLLSDLCALLLCV